MRIPTKPIILLIISLTLASLVVLLIKLPIEGVGGRLRELWELSRGGQSIDSPRVLLEGTVSLGLFLYLISMMVFDMRYRHFLAIAVTTAIVFLGVTPPQKLIESVDWALIVFLVGSMTFASILRKQGVFTYLAAEVVKLSRGRVRILLFLMSMLAWFTAMVIDEVTSIVYVVMLALEICRLLKLDPEKLVILLVLATNTGSLALPVGNPIGVYIAFTAGLSVREFLRYALPLSMICFILLMLVYIPLETEYTRRLKDLLKIRKESLEAFVTARVADLTPRERMARMYCLVLLLLFLVTVSATPLIAEVVSMHTGLEIDPNSLLALVPYLYIVLTLPVVEVSEYGEVIAKGVEWPSIAFFMFLFMLGFSLTWSGAMIRVAYATASLSGHIATGTYPLFVIIMTISAGLSSVLDNLSLIASLTPAMKLIVEVLNYKALYWSTFFGGVLGGNLTPVGSTANIVAVSMLERVTKRKVRWRMWVRTAAPVVAVQCLAAAAWSFVLFRV